MAVVFLFTEHILLVAEEWRRTFSDCDPCHPASLWNFHDSDTIYKMLRFNCIFAKTFLLSSCSCYLFVIESIITHLQ